MSSRAVDKIAFVQDADLFLLQKEQNLYVCFYITMINCPTCVCAGPQRAKVDISAASQASVFRNGPSEEVGGFSCIYCLIALWE